MLRQIAILTIILVTGAYHHNSHLRLLYPDIVRIQRTKFDSIKPFAEEFASYVRCQYSQLKLNAFQSDDREGIIEDLSVLKSEFILLADNKGTVSFENFLQSEPIQQIALEDESYIQDVINIWIKHAGSKDNAVQIETFIHINREIDELFEFIDDDDELIGNDITSYIPDITQQENNEEDYLTISETDVWETDFSPEEYFGPQFSKYLRDYYNQNCGEKGLSFVTFCSWDDIKQMLAAGELDDSCLIDLWREAVIETKKRISGDDDDNLMNANMGSSSSNSNKGFTKNIELKENINFNTFLRMNVRLEIVLEEIKDALENLTDEQSSDYYKAEFIRLSDGEELLTYNQLVEWDDIKQYLESGAISNQQMNDLWDALPKRPVGIFMKKKGNTMISQSDGITLQGFLSFNEAFNDLESISSGSEVVAEGGVLE